MIVLQVDDPATLRQLSSISKMHHMICDSVSFKAHYLLCLHQKCEVIFEAACRPGLLTCNLLKVSSPSTSYDMEVALM